MLKAIKIRLYLTEEQVDYINRLLGCCRFVYNDCLAYRKDSYEASGASVSDTDTVNRLTSLKAEHDFLRDVHSKVLQQSVRDLNTAYHNFFSGRGRYPKFKSKHDREAACRFPSQAFIGIRGNRIDLVRAFRDILFKCSPRDMSYLNKRQKSVKSVTVKRLACGIYEASVLVDYTPKIKDADGAVVGIDLGVKDLAITSDGERFENPHFHKSEEKRLKMLQRQLARKEKGSRNHDKARRRLAKAYKHITDRKRHYMHQATTRIVDENQVICLEDLNVSGMLRNHHLAKAIQEVSLSEFRRQVEYKAQWYGREVIIIDRFYASSKTCSKCGYRNDSLTLSDREWVCPVCGERHDRDVNAAINILSEGLRKRDKDPIGKSSPEFTPVDCPTVDDKVASPPLKSGGRSKQESDEIR